MILKPITGFPGYFIGDDGYAYTTRPIGRSPLFTNPRRLRGFLINGYYNVHLFYAGIGIRKPVHILVCEEFHGPRTIGMECRHGSNGNKDNRPPNLCWGTRAQNEMDKLRDGTAPRGENHGAHKLTLVDVKWVLSCRGKLIQKEMARMLGVQRSTIGSVLQRKTWTWVNIEEAA